MGRAAPTCHLSWRWLVEHAGPWLSKCRATLVRNDTHTPA